MQYQTTVTRQGLTYDPNAQAVPAPGLTLESWIDNSGTLPDVQTYTNTQTSQQAFTWTNTTTLSLGVTVSETAGVPNVASETCSATVTVTDAMTQGATYTNTQSWSIASQISTPPDASMKVDFTVACASYNVGYTASYILGNYICVWFNDHVNYPGGDGEHYCWFIPISTVLSDVRANNLADMSAFPDNSTVVLTGVFTGSQGISSKTLQNTQVPLRTGAAAASGAKPVLQPNYRPSANTVTLKTAGPLPKAPVAGPR